MHEIQAEFVPSSDDFRVEIHSSNLWIMFTRCSLHLNHHGQLLHDSIAYGTITNILPKKPSKACNFDSCDISFQWDQSFKLCQENKQVIQIFTVLKWESKAPCLQIN